MKIAGAAILILVAAMIGIASSVFGAMMIVSDNPTSANWSAYYLFTYAAPLALLLACVTVLIRMFR